MKSWAVLLLSTALSSVAEAQTAPAPSTSAPAEASSPQAVPNTVNTVNATNAAKTWLPFDQCFSAAAERFRVDKHMLIAIAKTESAFDPGAMGPRNADGTQDVGLMQINTRWLPRLAEMGIHHEKLKGPCTNIYVGAWILASKIRQHGTVWKAVGAYNAITPSKRDSYVSKVRRNYARVRAALLPKG